jgi:hypothetical protein
MREHGLAGHTDAGVVTLAQGLLELVSLDRHIEIEAPVSNRDVVLWTAASPPKSK